VKRKAIRRFPAEPLTLADVEALRAACSRRAPTGIRNRALLGLLFRSGLRISEALALFPKDIDPAGGSIRVLHGKGNKSRTAPLPPDAAEAVDRWLDCRKRLGLTGRHPLFCTLKGEPLWDSYVRALCKRLAAKAGVEKRVHQPGRAAGVRESRASYLGYHAGGLASSLFHQNSDTTRAIRPEECRLSCALRGESIRTPI
jgi:site-specific recombinase XerD